MSAMTHGGGDPGKFEGDDGAQAVPEQPQRGDAAPRSGLEETEGKVMHGFMGRFAEPVGPLWVLHDVGVAADGQGGCQYPVARGGCPGMREHHDGARGWPLVAAWYQLDPRRKRGRHIDQIMECHCAVSDFASC
jgi:hypothetical protein